MLKKLIFAVIAIVLGLSVVVSAETTIPILMYHNINPSYSPDRALVEMTQDEFKDQMTALLQNDYTPITLYDYMDWNQGKKELPEKPVIITFDDGYLNNYTHAFPIIKELKIPITIFVITGRMGMSDGVVYPHFTWEQAKEMENSGLVHIESHTHLHSDFNFTDYNSMILELRTSKYLFKKYMNKDVKFLAYPYGHFNDEVKIQAEKAGYMACVKIDNNEVMSNHKGDDVYSLKRLTARGGMTGQELIKLIEYSK